MKKLLVCVAALGMLFTSCMRDETRLDEGSVVSFNISSPAVSTRAAIEDTYGTGVAADDLHWAIFEADENGAAVGDAIFSNVEEGFFADGTLENTFNVRLVKGKSYVGMFWAQANGAPYKVEWPEVTIGDVKSNDEDLDAFFNIHNFSITAGQETGEQKVKLRRPFAQLNVAILAADLEAAKKAGFELAKTGVSLEAAKSLNLVTGLVSDVAEVTYALTEIPSGVTATLEGTEYQLISFNYILVDGDAWNTESDEGQELKNITFNYGTADETLSQTFQNIAVERNHRTYIVGSLLSETVDFRVIILPDWEDPYYLNNMEAGSIEMVAEQTTINKAAMGSATLTWNAVEGAVYYGVEYKGEELGKVNPDGSTRADEATTVTWNTPEGKVTDATASFTIKAYNENDKVIARVVTEPIAVFSLKNRPEPELRVLNGALEMATDFDWTDSYGADYNEFGNLHENGILVAAEVRFYKDNATTPAYTAYATCADQTGAYTTWRTGFNYKYVKGSNMFMAFKNWQWKEGTGSYGAATATMPEFAKGTYTVDYTAHYIAVLGGVYNNKNNDGTSNPDRMHFTAALESAVDNDLASLLAKAVARDGKSDLKVIKAEGTTVTAVAKGYQGATVTWEAVDGAASYKVFVGETEKASTTELTAEVTGLTDANKYKFTVKALDASGNVMSAGVSEEIQIFTLTGVREPEIVWENGALVAHKAYDLTALVSKLTVNFVKDGETKYTASYDKDNDTFNIYTGYRDNGRFTKNYFYDFPCSYGTGGLVWESTGTTAAPTFEVGEYTVEYTAEYVLYINGYWGKGSSSTGYSPAENEEESNRVMFDKADADEKWPDANLLMENGSLKKITRDGALTDKYVAGFNIDARIYDSTARMQTQYTDGHRGWKAVGGIYEGVKVSLVNDSNLASVEVIYTEGSDSKTVTKTASDWTVENGIVTFNVTGIKANSTTLTIKALDASNTVLEEKTKTLDIYHCVTPEAVFTATYDTASQQYKLKVSDWNNGYNSAYRLSFSIYKGDVAVHSDIKKNYDDASSVTLNAWLGNRGCNSWMSTDDYDGSIKTFALEPNTEYTVKYVLVAYPTIPDAAAQAANFHKTTAGWFYWSSILLELQTLPEVTTTFTTPAAE